MIINRYFAKEILQSLIAVLVVLLLIFVGRYFARYLAWAAEGFIPSNIILDLLLLRTISSLNLILPFGFFLAVLLAFGRFYKDSEMTALAAAGLSLSQIMRSVGSIALVVAVVVAAFSFYIGPWSLLRIEQVQDKAKTAPIIDSVSAGIFNEIASPPESVFYAKNFSEDGRYMNDVFVKIKKSDGRFEIFSAREGLQVVDPETGDRYLELRYGYQYLGKLGDMDFTVHQYKKAAIRIVPQQVVPGNAGVHGMTNAELWAGDDPAYVAEMQWRIALPISTLILALLAVLLSRASPRQGRYAKLFVAIIVFIIYDNGISVGNSWIERGVIPASVGLWWLHAFFAGLVVFLYYQQNHRLHWFTRRRFSWA